MTTKSDYQIITLSTPTALAKEAAYHFVRLAAQAAAARRRFTVALAGGQTPAAMYKLLTQSAYREQVDWENVYLFWGDERYVPPDNPDSSYRMATDIMLRAVPLLPDNIYPMPTTIPDPHAAARHYAQTIRAFFAPSVPRFDLVLLGVGTDGHTASLFPEQLPFVTPPDTLVTAVLHAPKPPPTRLTLTYPTINQAANIIFLVAGRSKAAIIAKLLNPNGGPVRYPAQKIRPVNGRLLWLLDEEAASELDERKVLRTSDEQP